MLLLISNNPFPIGLTSGIPTAGKFICNVLISSPTMNLSLLFNSLINHSLTGSTPLSFLKNSTFNIKSPVCVMVVTNNVPKIIRKSIELSTSNKLQSVFFPFRAVNDAAVILAFPIVKEWHKPASFSGWRVFETCWRQITKPKRAWHHKQPRTLAVFPAVSFPKTGGELTDLGGFHRCKPKQRGALCRCTLSQSLIFCP
jgi:hypothetical protein